MDKKAENKPSTTPIRKESEPIKTVKEMKESMRKEEAVVKESLEVMWEP